ncbi:unnamed protein product [Phytophthora lilii]|uniref:Unnamed protein product n=1 Tax=Phytophthora lilii TaxID=2077276 RepID=A0A9W6WPA7_9STRA|nr:unnamed protein product [Phytophthora lilii]
MGWPEEKAALLATIRTQEREAAALAKRFKLLQQTLRQQQTLLDRYQRALGVARTAETSVAGNSRNNIEEVLHTDNVKPATTTEPKLHAGAAWMKKKTAGSSDLQTATEVTVPSSVNKEAVEKKEQEKPKKNMFKSTEKRKSARLAATWAEEKRRMQKKPKWQEALSRAAADLDKENVRTSESRTNDKTDFAYVEVVRNREERKTLPAHDCVECKKYYDALGGLGAGDAAAQKSKCSRHRARFEPYQTPDDFWRLSFPDSEPGPGSPSVI